MKFSNLSIRSQLSVMVAVFLLMLLVMSAVALTQLNRSNERLVQMYAHGVSPMGELKAVSDSYAVQLVDTVHKLQHRSYTWGQALDATRTAELEIKRQWRAYREHDLSESEQDMANEAEALMAMGDTTWVRLKEIMMKEDAKALEAFSVQELYVTVDPITFQLKRMVDFQENRAQQLYSEAQVDHDRMRWFFVGLLMALTAIGLRLAWRLVQGVRTALMQAQQVAERIAQGDLSERLPSGGSNELAQLARSINAMQEQLQGQEDQRWIKSHVSEITTAMQLAESYTELGQVFLSKVAPLVQAGHGVFYVMNPEHRLQLLSTYGYQERKELSHLYEMGQGLVGQCALERSAITIHEPPADYVRISSGLGDGIPACIVLLPVTKLDEVLGVLELAGFHTFTPREVALLDALLPLMAMNLEILQRKMRTQRLLEETQEQAQRMEKQAAQLEEQAVEMEAQQAELMDTEAWYRSIVESAPDGLLVVNEAGVIVLCNTQAEQLFGYDHDELLGQMVEVLVPDSIRAHHPQNRAHFMASQGYRPIESGLEFRGRHKSGSEFPAEFGLSILPTRSSRGRCVAVSVRSAGEHKLAALSANPTD